MLGLADERIAESLASHSVGFPWSDEFTHTELAWRFVARAMNQVTDAEPERATLAEIVLPCADALLSRAPTRPRGAALESSV